MMTDRDNSYSKQKAAKFARENIFSQLEWLDENKDLDDNAMIIGLERKFFLGRKTSTETINRWKSLQS